MMKPTYEMALAAGVRDCGKGSVRYGTIPSYRGEAVVEMPDGARWLAIGHSSRGTAEILRQYGYIQFIPIHGPIPYRKIRAISPVVEADNALEGDEILVDGLKIIATWYNLHEDELTTADGPCGEDESDYPALWWVEFPHMREKKKDR